VIELRTNKKIFLLVLISFFLLLGIFSVQVNAYVAAFSDVIWVEENHSAAQEVIEATSSGSTEVDQTVGRSFQGDLSGISQGGQKTLQSSSGSNSSWFSRHLMCKDHDNITYDPIEPTTIFRPSDIKAVCLTTISTNDTNANVYSIEFRWHYRNNSSKTWVSCLNVSGYFLLGGIYIEQRYQCNFSIAGCWPGSNYPRAYKVDVYLDGSPSSFSEFFEVTNGGLNSSCTCEVVDVNGNPVNMKSQFTIGMDTKVHHYLRFDKIAYFNEELGCCHNFTTVWIQPNGSTYKTYSGNFTDYKDMNITWNYWEYNYTQADYISINPSTPIGNWKVEVYLDSYLNNTWMCYGPIATTPFTVGIADWTCMVYLDADNSLENAGIDIFLKISSVGSSSRVNVVVQMDRIADYDSRYGDWRDCYRFHVTEGMTPTPGNATLYLGEVNMGHPDTLKDFVNWTIHYYPANYYFLALWDHGAGCMGLCFDINATDFLSLPKLSQALSELPTIIDVVLLDACSMSMTEVAYQIKDYANVLVGPEGTGYAKVDGRAAPYDNYLSSLTSNSSILPTEFARKVVTDYINWCNEIDIIQNATMSATDLTKITSLMTAIDDFAIKLKQKETPYHEQISLARNLTEGYQGPYAGQTGYYIDLHHFAQLTNAFVLDEELQNAADQVMTTLESIIIIGANKSREHSHGLSIFFPDEKGKYDSFGSVYSETTFAEDTLWDEFVKYHLDIQTSGYVLTIQTPYPDIPVKVDEELYTTDVEGKLRVFVLADFYTINVSTPVLTGPGSRGVFIQWNDYETNPSRTITVTGPTTYTAYYKTQYEVTFSQSGVGTDFAGTVVTMDGTGYNVTDLPVSFWWDNGTTHRFVFQSPLVVTPIAKRYVWNSTSGLSALQSDPITVSTSGSVIGDYKIQIYLNLATSPPSVITPSGEGWYYNGTNASTLTAEFVDITGASRYRFNGWTTIDMTEISDPNSLSTTVRMDKTKTVTANYVTQYYLNVTIDPTGLSPQPNVSQPGPWYVNGTLVTCTAQKISGYVFDHWTADGKSWNRGVNPINVTMDGSYEATAHYLRALAWWENLFCPQMLPVILGFGGILLAVALVGTAWVRTRRRRGIMRERAPFLHGLTKSIDKYRVLAVLVHGHIGAENVISDLISRLEPRCAPILMLGPTAPTQLSLPKEAKVGWVTTISGVSELEYPILSPEDPSMVNVFLTKALETVPEDKRPVILGDFLDNMIPHMNESLFYKYYSDLASAARMLNYTVVFVVKTDIHREVGINVVKRFADVIIEYREREEKGKLAREVKVSNRVDNIYTDWEKH